MRSRVRANRVSRGLRPAHADLHLRRPIPGVTAQNALQKNRVPHMRPLPGLQFDFAAGFFQRCGKLFSVFLGEVFLHGLWGAVNEGLGFL